MGVSAKDIAKSAGENTYFGVGYSTKSGASVGAQSINAQDNYTAETNEDDHRQEAKEKVSKALSKIQTSRRK